MVSLTVALGCERLQEDDVARAEEALLVSIHGKSDVRRQTNARRGHVQLAMSEARLRQGDAHALQRLALRLVDPISHRTREAACCQ